MLKIREIRLSKNLTIGELSERADISSRMLSNYEINGSDISLSKLIAIANALDVYFWELVEVDEGETVKTPMIIDSEETESLNRLPLEIQNTILKSYLAESKKLIKALQGDKIEVFEERFKFLEEFVLDNITGLLGKSQARTYREKLLEKIKELEKKSNS